jgi:hypothetical protein
VTTVTTVRTRARLHAGQMDQSTSAEVHYSLYKE